MKSCSKCKKEKPLNEFGNDKRQLSGKRSECKDCQRIKIKEWNEHNKSRRKIRDAEYHKKRYFTGYRREYQQRWYQQNKDKIREQHKTYMKEHREAATLRTAVYRQRKLGLECTLTKEQWEIIKLVFRHRCVYCGKRTNRLEKEHVIPVVGGGGFTLQNIVPACRQCNAKKHTSLPKVPVKLLLI